MFSAAGGYTNSPSRRSSESLLSAVGRSTIRLAGAGITSGSDVWSKDSAFDRKRSKTCSGRHTPQRSVAAVAAERALSCKESPRRRPGQLIDEEAQLLTHNQQSSINRASVANHTQRDVLDSRAPAAPVDSKNVKRRGTLNALRRRLSNFRGVSPNSVKSRDNGSLQEADASSEHDCRKSGCERVRLNVSGQYYDTFVGLLNRHPDTLLGNPDKRRRLYDAVRNEYFIDRHRPSFEAIFEYYQHGGKLKRPVNVPDDIFLAELLYYELEDQVLDEYKEAEGYTKENIVLPENETLRKIWILFEFPETSWAALAIAILSVIMTVASIVLFCVETLPVFALSHCVEDEAPNFLDPFFVIETTCTVWFTLELLIRFVACPNKLLFWRDFKNLIDLTAIVPYYVTFINVVSTMSCASAKSSASLAFLRVIRLVRVFKLTKHSVGLQILILTFKASLEGLGLFLVALTVCLLVFSSAIYFAELGVPGSQIASIPDAFWWAIITMTTVGYGDKVPVGCWGKFIGSICALVGVLTLAIPVPIITGNFNRFYAHKTGRMRHT